MTDRQQILHATARHTMLALGMVPDPWQMDVLTCDDKRLLLNCARQAGKSTTVAVLSLLATVGKAGTKVLLLAPSLRQSRLLFRTAARFLERMGQRFIKNVTIHELNLNNGSQIVCLPCKEQTIRGYADVGLLVIDEAARVPDDLFKAVMPMLAVSNGRMVLLSTPHGRRGFFYDAWAKGGDDWKRIEVNADQVPRITKEELEANRRLMGESWLRQEFYCSFEALEGLVYPDFARCVVKVNEVPPGRWFGGLDFGLRNPFAAVWGVIDRDDVLWLVGEHYARDKTLDYHARHLSKRITWYADPSGAREIKELRCFGLAVRLGDNDDAGIAAVRSRIENGTLKIVEGTCPNLLAEARLYRYDPDSPRSEKPRKENDHALDALRYLISKLDWKKMARIRRRNPPDDDASALVPNPPPDPKGDVPKIEPPPPKTRKWLSLYNEALWTRIG
jgi:hypothetical protein